MIHTMSGGCQCGRIRFTARLEHFEAYLCHCRMCQRATGGMAVPYVSLRKDQRDWHGEPDWYASSPIARRPFCSRCGTPLGTEYPDDDLCDLLLGCFDDPSPFLCTRHYGVEAIHAHWLDLGHLPRVRSDDDPSLVERWAKYGLKPPE